MYGPTVVAVTTERGSHWWGRETRHDTGTHGRMSSLQGRFETIEQATAVKDEVQRVRDHFQRQRAILDNARRELSQHEEALQRQITSGRPQRLARLVWVRTTLSAEPLP